MLAQIDCSQLHIWDLVLHFKDYLTCFISEHGSLTYFLLALIIFCETGLVATPFLPGDSLLFTAGLFCAKAEMGLNVWMMIPLLICAAIIGDNLNYFIGRKFGVRLFDIKFLSKIIKRDYLTKTEVFFDKHGGKAIIMARFIPLIRTFAPFAAGIGKMPYKKYMTFCVIGAVVWVSLLSLAGFFLGQNEWINKNYEKVVLGIIAISVLPVVFGLIKSKIKKS